MTRDLLNDFYDRYPGTDEFFRATFFEKESRVDTIRKVSSKLIHPAVVQVLIDQNPAISTAIEKSLAKLRTQSAVVITGQQLGLFGGPLHTLYKILTAIKLANKLEEESGVNVIPIFWLQSEDHDFDEIRKSVLFDAKENIISTEISVEGVNIGDLVGEIVITETAGKTISTFLDENFSQEDSYKAILKKSYAEGMTLSQALSSFFRSIFAEYGLLVFDPNSKKVKEQYKEFIASSFLRSKGIGALLSRRVEELRALGYEEQVKIKPNSPLFFLSSEGKRFRLEEISDGKWIGGGKEIDKSDLYDILDRFPERFTTSALIRPVFQDTLFPTAAYVCGPSEFNYWVQIKPLYEFFGVAQPLVVPRASFTFYLNVHTKLFDKLKIEPSKLTVESSEFVKERFRGSLFDPVPIFTEIRSGISTKLEEVAPIFSQIDPDLPRWIGKTKESILSNLERLQGKYEQSLARKEGDTVRWFERLKKFSFPNGDSQEKVISMVCPLLLCGKPVLKSFYDSISLFERFHNRSITIELP